MSLRVTISWMLVTWRQQFGLNRRGQSLVLNLTLLHQYLERNWYYEAKQDKINTLKIGTKSTITDIIGQLSDTDAK